jgi:putative addiction module killer protein
MSGELVVRSYMTADGHEPFMEWLTRLKDHNAIVAVDKRIGRIRLGNLGDHKHIGDGVNELRIHHGPGYRLYFGRDGEAVVILLCGGDKGSQRRDMAKAKSYWDDYRSRDDS